MKLDELEQLKPLVAKYNIQMQTEGTKILRVNGHESTLDAADYMPDQLINVILEVVGSDLRQALFRAQHE